MNSCDQTTDKMRRFSRAILVLTTLAFGLLMIPMGMASIMSPMAFDSGENLTTWVLVGSVCSYVPLALISIPASWALFRLCRYGSTIVVSLLPLVDLFIIAVTFTYAYYFRLA
jgi:hypothetical protein